jgi:hypothetical protein
VTERAWESHLTDQEGAHLDVVEPAAPARGQVVLRTTDRTGGQSRSEVS